MVVILPPLVVAFRKESVDRNDTEVGIPNTNTSVAFRKESVDRNAKILCNMLVPSKSLSARRAWIEIRNILSQCQRVQASLSARRAWIEISGPLNAACIWVVAFRKESVDRNIGVGTTRACLGVAFRKESVDRNTITATVCHPDIRSLSARRAWIEIHNLSRAWAACHSRFPQGERG